MRYSSGYRHLRHADSQVGISSGFKQWNCSKNVNTQYPITRYWKLENEFKMGIIVMGKKYSVNNYHPITIITALQKTGVLLRFQWRSYQERITLKPSVFVGYPFNHYHWVIVIVIVIVNIVIIPKTLLRHRDVKLLSHWTISIWLHHYISLSWSADCPWLQSVFSTMHTSLCIPKRWTQTWTTSNQSHVTKGILFQFPGSNLGNFPNPIKIKRKVYF